MFIQLHNNYWAKPCGDNYIVFHESLGEPVLLSQNNFARLEKHQLTPNFIDELSSLGIFQDDRVHKECRTKSEAFISAYSGPIVLDLILSEACNLNCHMCSHAQTTSISTDRIRSSKLMSKNVAIAWIDYYIDRHIPKMGLQKYIFHYGAAEPFLNKGTFLESLRHIHRKTAQSQMDVEQLVNTNLTLLDDELVDALRSYSVKVSVGLDGLSGENDLIRVTKKGKGTFHTITRNIARLRKEGISVGVALTMTERNFMLLNPKLFLTAMLDIGVSTVLVDSDFIHRIPFDAGRVTDMLVSFYQLGEQLGIEILGSWRTPFANLTTENDDEPKAFCTSLLGKNLTVTPSGTLTFCTYSGTQLSCYNSDQFDFAVSQFISEIKKLMSSRLPTLNSHCTGCPLSGLCSGGCYLTYEVTGNRHSMCDIYLNATSKLIDHTFSKETV